MIFLKRLISSLIYVGLLLGSLYANSLLFTLVLFVLSTITLWEVQHITQQKTHVVYLFFPLLYGLTQYGTQGEVIVLIIAVVGVLFLVFFYGRKKKEVLSKLFVVCLAFFGICAPLVVLALLGGQNAGLALFFFCVIWLNDTGAYLVGSWIGKRPLAPTTSPNKTIEGSVGGVLFSTSIAMLVFHYFGLIDTQMMLVLALASASLGVLGDLVQSKLKRLCDVKNSGSIMPGHGGVYDRIDSLLLAIPVFKLLLFLYVP